MEKLRVASLFSGCGGMDLGMKGGFEFLGKKYQKNPVELVFANDIEDWACEIFNANFAHKIVKKDIRKISSSDIPEHDIILAGFPCQPFSIVAQNPPRMGLESDIGQLFLELVRILKKKKPMCFIAENVKGILSANKRKAFPSILKKLEKTGYSVDYKLLNSENYGVPQKRERVFIIGYRKDLGILPEFPEPQRKKIPLKNVLISKKMVDKKYYFSKKAVEGLRKANPLMNKGRAQDLNSPCSTVGAHLAKVSLNSTDPVLKELRKFRRFMPREVARIQSFPDSFELVSSENKQYRVLGNAVPPLLMWYVSRTVLRQLLKLKMHTKLVIPIRR